MDSAGCLIILSDSEDERQADDVRPPPPTSQQQRSTRPEGRANNPPNPAPPATRWTTGLGNSIINLGSDHDPIVLSDSENESPMRVSAYSDYVRQTADLEGHHPWRLERRQVPLQRSSNRPTAPALGFSQLARGVHQPARVTAPINPPRAPVPTSTPRVSTNRFGRASIPPSQEGPTPPGLNMTVARLALPYPSSSATRRVDNPSPRMSTACQTRRVTFAS